MIHVFDVADQIADDFQLIDFLVRHQDVRELIFDHDHQFQAVEPVSPQIIGQVRFIRHTFDVDAQVVGYESADIIGGKDFSRSRCLLTYHTSRAIAAYIAVCARYGEAVRRN